LYICVKLYIKKHKMAKNKVRKGVKEKQAKAKRLKAEAKTLQQRRMQIYIDQLMLQMEEDKKHGIIRDEFGNVVEDIVEDGKVQQ